MVKFNSITILQLTLHILFSLTPIITFSGSMNLNKHLPSEVEDESRVDGLPIETIRYPNLLTYTITKVCWYINIDTQTIVLNTRNDGMMATLSIWLFRKPLPFVISLQTTYESLYTSHFFPVLNLYSCRQIVLRNWLLILQTPCRTMYTNDSSCLYDGKGGPSQGRYSVLYRT